MSQNDLSTIVMELVQVTSDQPPPMVSTENTEQSFNRGTSSRSLSDLNSTASLTSVKRCSAVPLTNLDFSSIKLELDEGSNFGERVNECAGPVNGVAENYNEFSRAPRGFKKKKRIASAMSDSSNENVTLDGFINGAIKRSLFAANIIEKQLRSLTFEW